MEKLLHEIKKRYQLQLPFVIYALPNSKMATALLQNDEQDHSSRQFCENGFVFAPFHEETALFIPQAECLVSSEALALHPVADSQVNCDVIASEKETYIALVDKAIGHIREGRASKIVLSRIKEFALPTFDLISMIDRLFNLYPTAFRYVWYHPVSGLWCGATPEELISTRDKTFSTMALAGTKLYDPKKPPIWSRKELGEQQLVTEAITDKLQQAASVIKVSKVKDHVAGTLVHLRTDFKGVLKKGEQSLELLARSLHPTPAVCGTPFDAAKQFIRKNEPYDRRYYTGFLGPIELYNGHSQLFVNLRCAEISGNKARLFAGGGVTEDSKAVEEFYETQNKLQTMLQVLQPML